MKHECKNCKFKSDDLEEFSHHISYPGHVHAVMKKLYSALDKQQTTLKKRTTSSDKTVKKTEICNNEKEESSALQTPVHSHTS